MAKNKKKQQHQGNTRFKYKKNTEKAENRAKLEKEQAEQEALKLQEEAKNRNPDYVVTHSKGPAEYRPSSTSKTNYADQNISSYLTSDSKKDKKTKNTSSDKKKPARIIKKKIISTDVAEPPKATAAYNFVSLPQTVLLSPVNDQLKRGQNWNSLTDEEIKQQWKTYIQKNGTHSGTIDLTLENLTPLFIGTANDSDVFFSPAGKPVIPGSTLRGLMRNLFKIITAGAMRRNEDFVDQHLYYRCIMATGNNYQNFALFNEYALNRMLSTIPDPENPGKMKQVKNTRKGFLFRRVKDSSYAIAPCDMSSVPIDLVEQDVPSDNSCVVWYKAEKAAAVWTGTIGKKKTVRVLHHPRINDAIEVPEAVIESYKNDKNRGKNGVNLLDEDTMLVGGEAQQFADFQDIDRIVPCFYVEEDGVVTAFGHGRSFRIPYKNSIGDKVPIEVQTEKVDFADAVFGRKELWAGRVSFEDAELTGTPDFLRSAMVKPLLGANPTSFQLYLKQSSYPAYHWDSDKSGTIRGYKQYWHKQIGPTDWQDTSGKTYEELKDVTHAIRPLAKGQHFTAKIHFRELSDIELGALLKLFNLGAKGQDIVFKIGLGKSLGMGSVRVKATPHLDSKKRYEHLFIVNGWDEDSTPVDTQDFIKTFDDYAKTQLGKSYASYETALRELRIMLDWNNTKKPNWAAKVASMSGDVEADTVDSRFVTRSLLPTPEDIVR